MNSSQIDGGEEEKNASNADLGKETASATIAYFAQALSGFVGTVVFARLLGPTSFGGFYLLFAVVNIVDRPLGGWTRAAQKRFSEVESNRSEIFGAMVSGVVIWSVVAVVGAVLASDALASYTGLDKPVMMFVALMATVAALTPNSLVEARGFVGASLWTDTLRSYLTLGLQLALILGGLGVAGMAFGLAGATLLVLPIFLYFASVWPSVPSWETIRNLWVFAQFSIPTAFLGQAYDRFDVLLLGLLLVPAVAGNYEVAAKLTLPATYVASSASTLLMPRVSRLASEGRGAATELSRTLAFTAILSSPIFFGALALPRSLVVTVYGPEYRGAAPLLVGLAAYRIVSTQTEPLFQTLDGLDMPEVNFRLSAVALFVNVILGVLLTWLYGAIGVVVATVVAESIRYVGARYVLRGVNSDIEFFSRPQAEQLFAGVVMFAAVSGLHTYLAIDSWVDLTVHLLLGCIVYGSLLLLISHRLRVTLISILDGTLASATVRYIDSRLDRR